MKSLFAFLLFLCLGICACTGIKKQKAELDVSEPSPAKVYTDLGIVYLARDQDGLALENFKLALETDSKNSEAHHAIAILYKKLDQKSLSEYHLKQAVSLRSSNARAQTDYGNYLCDEGNYAQAEERFQKAIKTPLYKTPWTAMTNAGICAERAGRLKDAENFLRQALKRQPNFSPALLAMAKISLKTDNPLSGRGFIQRYLSAAPPNAQALLVGMRIEQTLGDLSSANKYRSQLESQFPDSKQAKSLLDEPE